MRCFLLLIALASGSGLGPVRLQDPAPGPEQVLELPPPLTEYMGRRIAQTMHWSGADWLLRETRESEEHTARMLAALNVSPGSVVCDLGCGVGYLTLPLAQLVGSEGRVLAVDIQEEMLAGLAQRLRDTKLENVEPILGTLADPKLKPGTCDLVLMVDVYHELGYPEHVLKAVRAALKPRGRLVLVEFRGEDENVPIKPEHKMKREQIQAELKANGFRLQGQFDELPWQHMLTFLRDDAPLEPSPTQEKSTGGG